MPSILDALWEVESGGIPGRMGPQTKYGRALGKGQTLPGTAREMAQKIGLPWRPDLLTANTPEAEQYQEAVSEAYYNEGLERTGSPRDALRYYHGGPNRRQWGPKTNAYADKVLSLAGGGEQPMAGFQQQGPSPRTLEEAQQKMLGMAGGPMNMQDEILERPGAGGIAEILASLPNLDDAQIKKPKPFQKGGIGLTLAGIIADGIASGFGAQPGYGPALRAETEHNRALQLWREKVAQERADRLDTANSTLARQIALEQWKRDNPEAPDPTSLERNITYLKRLNPSMTDEQAYAIAKQNINRPIMIGGQPYGFDADTGEESGGVQTQTIDGVTYYNVGGKWYDNPEGR